MQCNETERKALLTFIQNTPECHTALIFEQIATLSRASATLAKAVATIAQGFADSKLRPNRYLAIDSITRRDFRTEVYRQAASAFGDVLAALEVLSALSDALPQDFRHSAETAYHLRYNDLKTLCYLHGYREAS